MCSDPDVPGHAELQPGLRADVVLPRPLARDARGPGNGDPEFAGGARRPRGFAAVALDNPKCVSNVGGTMRAAQVYGAALIVISGQRFYKFKNSAADTMKAWRHTPVIETADVFDALPHDCVPVACDLVPGAIPLPRYKHPERAFYIFGAEDATLGSRILSRCRDVIVIPIERCMNLACTVNVVLYDRMAKAGT